MRRIGRTGMVLSMCALLAVMLTLDASPAIADNQTPTVSKVSRKRTAIPFRIELREVTSTARTLPNLQSFASGQVDGLWVILGGRTNGLHDFTDDGLKNFPPSKQNRRIWVIDPWTGTHWSRRLADSSLSGDQVDALSSTAQESLQVGNTLYVIGGYGYSRSQDDFLTFDSLTAVDLDDIVAWVRSPDALPTGKRDLADIVRQTSRPVLKVTGGQATTIGNRTILAFGQLFDGPYGGPGMKQVYTEQIRSFSLHDNGRTVRVRDVRRDPTEPNPEDYRRRDYTLIPYIAKKDGRLKPQAAALAGVFTETNGIFTVPVEIKRRGRPSMADPDRASTFRQAMSGYDTAYLPVWDRRTKKSHAVLFAGISYVYYDRTAKTFVEDPQFPFINDISVITRNRRGKYTQTLFGQFPKVTSADGKRLRFGAEAHVFVNPQMPLTDNGMVDLRRIGKGLGQKGIVAGHFYGGIAADAPNGGNTVASNLIFEIVLKPR